ncbi:MAG: S41 family peptidase [Aggregatilineales bacterium]
MTCRKLFAALACAGLLLAALAAPTLAQDAEPVALDDMLSAVVVNDEGGPAIITGSVSYTNPFFTSGVAQPLVILEDQAGFVDRDETYLMPVESQVLGQITSDFFTSPFTYSLTLPRTPRGAFRDVDNNGRNDIGVQIFAIAYWSNTFGDPFLEERDLYGGGWSTAYASTLVSGDSNRLREIVGGKLLVYAPDDNQGFPAGFGLDGLLFTGDEPVVRLPAGWTTVNLDTDPFTFDRAAEQVIDLLEPESAAVTDFSGLRYRDAFDAMVDKLSREYAFTEYKGIDWEALRAQFRPRVIQAEKNRSALDFRRAIRDFAQSIPDGHVAGPQIAEDIQAQFGGGLGLAVRELDDGRVLVTFVLAGGPADQAGIQRRAEILAVDGVPIADAVAAVTPPSAPFSTEHNRRLEQLRFVLRRPLGSSVQLTFRNPGAAAAETARLTATREFASYAASALTPPLTGLEVPVEFRALPGGYVYAKIYGFSDNALLTVQLWERLIRALNERGAPGLVIDMRQNGGGSGFLANQMAAYFFDTPHALGNSLRYDSVKGDFYADNRSQRRFYLPPEDLRYRGPVAVLVSPDCYSACEFFAYSMTTDNRAAIVGQYPTGGLGGGVEDFYMPEGIRFRFTVGRAVDANGRIHIEGVGVVPTVRVPVTEETLFSGGDPVLEAALAYLRGR